jgi:hypothetical protein
MVQYGEEIMSKRNHADELSNRVATLVWTKYIVGSQMALKWMICDHDWWIDFACAK